VRNGQLHDMYGYGLLKREFDELRENLTGRMEGKSLIEMIDALHAKEEEAGA